jgi:beta-galactosidase/beta-glucuronidase
LLIYYKANMFVHAAGNSSSPVSVSIFEPNSNKRVAHAKGNANSQLKFKVENPKLWSPDSPNLYDISVVLGEDKVTSYTGFRTISRGEIGGVQRPLLNGEFLFQMGTLDQGYWPDGIYTPPSVEAMVYDIKVLKRIGYNMLRKHVSGFLFQPHRLR